MNIIFAVDSRVYNSYVVLAQEIHGASVGLLSQGKNIAQLVKAQYDVSLAQINWEVLTKGSVKNN